MPNQPLPFISFLSAAWIADSIIVVFLFCIVATAGGSQGLFLALISGIILGGLVKL